MFFKKDVLRNFPKFTEKQTPAQAFLVNFAIFFGTLVVIVLLLYGYRMLCKIGILKHPAKFTAKFVGTAASGTSENRPCLAGYNFIDVLQS